MLGSASGQGLFGKHGLRWRIALLLLSMTAINYLDRQALAVAAPALRKDLGISTIEYGYITSAFLLCYAVGQAFSGALLDRFGIRRTMQWAVAAWSVVGILHAFGRSFLSFFLLRAALGLVEAVNFPAAMKGVATWFPRNERALGASMIRVGTGIGAIAAPPALGMLIYFYGWHAAFIAAGALGFVWLLLWNRMYYDLDAHPRVSDAERTLIAEGSVAETPGAPPRVRDLLRRGDLLGLMAARFFADNLLYFYLFWLPIYLSDARGFNLLQIGLFAWIPFLFSDLGGLFVGRLSGWLIERGWTVRQARLRLLWLSGILVPIAGLAAVVDNAFVALGLISFGLFANQFKTTPLFTLPTDMFPARSVGTAWGLCGAAGSIGATLFQPAIGWTVEHYSYPPVFVVISALPLIAAILVSCTVRTLQ
jgi:MFS transporter, ACS family, hexuronate transporter